MLETREYQCLQLGRASRRPGPGHFLSCMLECCWSMSFYKVQKRDKAGGLELVRGEIQVPKEIERGDISRKGTFLLEDVQFCQWRFKGSQEGKTITVMRSGWRDDNNSMELMIQCKTCNVPSLRQKQHFQSHCLWQFPVECESRTEDRAAYVAKSS